ncbi:cellulose biosynthesis protein BcsQ [Pseudoalteromonas sp.]|uniref:cellulose biosynthesis protein BcsQ n=1 Tax=Pseudoalteromonas sp. TaxID=53249 RepID=UPI0035666168
MNRVFLKGIKGGTGTTSIIANIATLLANSGHNVLCIDLDPKNELCLHLGHQWQNQSGWSNKVSETNANWTDIAYINEDNVKYIPFGSQPANNFSLSTLLNQSKRLALESDSWLLFDVPSHISLEQLPLDEHDIVINVVTCDPGCYSQIKKRRLDNNGYYLINRFNASNPLELDVYQIWRANLKRLAPFFIHFDSAVPEALAAKNVLINCSPLSVVKEDFHALASWLNNKRKSLSKSS